MTKVRSFVSRSLFAVAIALSIAVVPGQAVAEVLSDFQITPTALGGTDPAVTADKMVGGYVETFSVTGPGTFTTDAYWVAGQFFANDGTSALSPNTTGLGSDYGLYVLFTATGTFSVDGVTGEVSFTATSGYLELWVDNFEPGGVETTFTAAANAALTVGNDVILADNADDELLATAPLYFGVGDADPNQLNSGNFEIIFQPFTLTALGSTYFTQPVPFYMVVNVAGQFNFFEPEGNQIIDGSADAFFQPDIVPEPASLALLGTGLLGLAARRRRNRKA